MNILSATIVMPILCVTTMAIASIDTIIIIAILSRLAFSVIIMQSRTADADANASMGANAGRDQATCGFARIAERSAARPASDGERRGGGAMNVTKLGYQAMLWEQEQLLNEHRLPAKTSPASSQVKETASSQTSF